MRLPSVIRDLFPDHSDNAFATRHYCMSCVALRLLGIGFEPQINAFTGRELMLLAILLPPHARNPIFALAHERAEAEGDQNVLALFSKRNAA